MAVIINGGGPEFPGGGGGGIDPPDPPPNLRPGLGGYLRPRYTCNLAVTEFVPLIDLLHDCIFIGSRMFISQGEDGRIRFHNKKPADWALGSASFPAGDTVLDLDNVSPWVADPSAFLLIDPHTVKSEIREVVDAYYPTFQNTVTLTSSEPTDISVTTFSGASNGTTPATATITVNSFTPDDTYTVTLSGFAVSFTPSSGDTEATIAAFIAGTFRSHPAITRGYRFENPTSTTVLITALWGILEINEGTAFEHLAPIADPAAAVTLTASAGALAAGAYKVSYALKNDRGQTLLAPYKSIILTAGQKVTTSAVTMPAGATSVVWYVSPEAGSNKLRAVAENTGAAIEINALPKLTASVPPDLNRTGCEVMRVRAVFSDRGETRSHILRSNVLRGTFEWILGNRREIKNTIKLKYRESGQDWRGTELILKDDTHIAKVKKTLDKEVNGQAIDTFFQAHRIAAALLAEYQDAAFFYRWTATREALLLEEGDVVAITDDGSGVYNLPVWIEDVELDVPRSGMPHARFRAMKYASTLWDDSVVDRQIPVITEREDVTAPSVPEGLTATVLGTTSIQLEWDAAED